MKGRTRRAARKGVAPVASLVLLALSLPAAPAAAKPLGQPQQVSFAESLDDMTADSTDSAIAYGGGKSLVVWEQGVNREQTRGSESDGTQIMGRFVNGAGTPISNPFRIDDNPQIGEHELNPDVAYDAKRDRFFVVWDSEFIPPPEDRTLGGRIIRGARVAPSGDVTPSVVLTPDTHVVRDPTTAYGSTPDELLVAYDTFGSVAIRKVNAETLTPQEEGVDILDGVDIAMKGDTLPDTAFDAAAGRWLVVFVGFEFARGFDGVGVFARSFDANLDGSDPVRVSQTDDEEELFTSADEPSVAADEAGGGFLVVYEWWEGTFLEIPEGPFRQERGIVAERAEIFSRRVTGAGAVDGDPHQVSDDPQVSDPAEPEDFEALNQSSRRPDVWHDPNADQFLVSWAQDVDNNRGEARVDGSIEYEVFGKKVDTAGAPLEADTQISNHRPDAGSRQFDGDLPAVTYDRTVCDYVVSWTGEETNGAEPGGGGSTNEKEEIWDRPYDAPNCPKPEPTSAAAGQVAASRVCASRRNFPIRLVKRRNRDYEFALVKVNGTPVNVTYGDRVRAQVNLVGLPVGRFAVDIEARLENGRTLKGVRRYFTCNRKLPPSNGLDRPEAL